MKEKFSPSNVPSFPNENEKNTWKKNVDVFAQLCILSSRGSKPKSVKWKQFH